MSPASSLLRRCRTLMGGYQHWDRELVRLFEHDGSWIVYCGQGRFDVVKQNAAYSKGTGVALNFAVRGNNDDLVSFEFRVAWPDDGWQLMFHLDPDHANWPEHPRMHIQMQPPQTLVAAPPFHAWRLPMMESSPERLLHYLVAKIR